MKSTKYVKVKNFREIHEIVKKDSYDDISDCLEFLRAYADLNYIYGEQGMMDKDNIIKYLSEETSSVLMYNMFLAGSEEYFISAINERTVYRMRYTLNDVLNGDVSYVMAMINGHNVYCVKDNDGTIMDISFDLWKINENNIRSGHNIIYLKVGEQHFRLTVNYLDNGKYLFDKIGKILSDIDSIESEYEVCEEVISNSGHIDVKFDPLIDSVNTKAHDPYMEKYFIDAKTQESINVVINNHVFAQIRGLFINFYEENNQERLSRYFRYFYSHIKPSDMMLYTIVPITCVSRANGDRLVFFALNSTNGDLNEPLPITQIPYSVKAVLDQVNLAIANTYTQALGCSEDEVLGTLNNIPYAKVQEDSNGPISLMDRTRDIEDIEFYVSKDRRAAVADDNRKELQKMISDVLNGRRRRPEIGIIRVDKNGNIEASTVDNGNDDEDDIDDDYAYDFHSFLSHYREKFDKNYNEDILVVEAIQEIFGLVMNKNFRMNFIVDQNVDLTIKMRDILRRFISNNPLSKIIMDNIVIDNFDVGPRMGFFMIFDFKISNKYILTFIMYYNPDIDDFEIKTFNPETCSGFSLREQSLGMRKNAAKYSNCLIINSKFGDAVIKFDLKDFIDQSDIIRYSLSINGGKNVTTKMNRKFGIYDAVIITIMSGIISYLNKVVIDKTSIMDTDLHNFINPISGDFNNIYQMIEDFSNDGLLSKLDLKFIILSLKDYLNNTENKSKHERIVGDIDINDTFDVKQARDLVLYNENLYHMGPIYSDGSYYIEKFESAPNSKRDLGIRFFVGDNGVFIIAPDKNSTNDIKIVEDLYKISKFIFINKYGKDELE